MLIAQIHIKYFQNKIAGIFMVISVKKYVSISMYGKLYVAFSYWVPKICLLNIQINKVHYLSNLIKFAHRMNYSFGYRMLNEHLAEFGPKNI